MARKMLIKKCVLFCLFFIILPNYGLCDLVWFPVFIAFEKNGMPVYEAWKTPNIPNDLPTIFTQTGKGKHLRSHLIDHWTEMNIKMVKMELFKNDKVVVWMTFNANNTNNLSWFSKANLYQSSFTDLFPCSPTNYFSAEGFVRTNDLMRRFYINRVHNGCPGDFGWFAILDSHDVCSWGRSSSYPTFRYTKGGRNWATEFDSGDTLVIYIATDV